ncbi:alpha/beta fold hydrolase [Xenorhabdus sp. PB61.4]|uniref:alpha/beta hydrolase family protein n=1 Tax=Xenorhabdus sp. PB61.4 TaxID=2788940 RepID=UPI001E5E70D5|nr:alpha/beta fold hydrolase [Xenorhabdus sp. PB61.4]MCC8366913.1 alpha/beta fold hydrolase [Xenorhabdus sp. PB61.4]
MFKRIVATIFLFLCFSVKISASENIGFREIFLDKNTERPLHFVMWYPSNDIGHTVIVGEHPAYYGISVIKNAIPDIEKHPLVVLSHGYGGNWRNLNWLAGELAKKGFIVAAPNHPGTTTEDRNPLSAAQLWERPRDLSRVIDFILEQSDLAELIDKERIAAIGHSLGGWSVVELTGARFNSDLLVTDCKTNQILASCNILSELGIGKNEITKAKLDGDLGDQRVKAIISLDLALTRGFSPQSLSMVHIPTLVVAAGVDVGDMPAELESEYLAKNLPKEKSKYIVIDDAMHFSFRPNCKPNAIALIEKNNPKGGVICKDGGDRSRKEIHNEILNHILIFFQQVFPK